MATKKGKKAAAAEPPVEETSMPEAEETAAPSHPERVSVRFKGPGIGMLAGRQVLAGEVYEVSWTQWLAVSHNRKYERIDV